MSSKTSWLMRWRESYSKRPLSYRLLISFLFNCAVWFVAYYSKEWVTGQKYELKDHLFSTFWMGSMFTIFSNWQDLQSLFKKKTKAH